MEENNDPKYIKMRGVRVHNLKNIDVDVPLHQIVWIAGASGTAEESLPSERWSKLRGMRRA